MTAPVKAEFTLVDDEGRTVTENDYRGKWMLVYFGFTNCQVVCPRTLAKLDAVLDDLGPLSDDIEALFISVDPQRDTPQAMHDYLSSAHPRFTGLTGSAEELARARRGFRVFVHERALDANSTAHTAFTYLIDANGQYVTHWPESAEASVISRGLVNRLVGDGRAQVAEPAITPVETAAGHCCEQ